MFISLPHDSPNSDKASALRDAVGLDMAWLENWRQAHFSSRTEIWLEVEGKQPHLFLKLDARAPGILQLDALEISLFHKSARLDEIAIKDIGQGLGRQIVAGLVALLEQVGVEKFALRAGRSQGAYFWARCGFLPAHCRAQENLFDEMAKRAQALAEIGQWPSSLRMPSKADQPQKLWEFADMQQAVRPPNGLPQPLGYYLLAGLEYAGEFRLDNPIQQQRLQNYCHRHQHATAPSANIASYPTHKL